MTVDGLDVVTTPSDQLARRLAILRQGTPMDMIRPDALQEIYDMQIKVLERDGKRICLFYD